MNRHICFPYCDGQKYEMEPGAHVMDCFIRDDCVFPLEVALKKHKRVLESHGMVVIRYWPEADYKPVQGPMLVPSHVLKPQEWKVETVPTTYTKYPPYLFLVKPKLGGYFVFDETEGLLLYERE